MSTEPAKPGMQDIGATEHLPIDLEGVLATMSLRQKIGQMVQAERMSITPHEAAQWGVGSILSGAGSAPGQNTVEDWLTLTDAYWQAAKDAGANNPVIPPLYAVDAVHGHSNVAGATIFPHNCGLGATGDAVLIKRIAQATALEMLATGVDWTFAPTLALAQDMRWGRVYESFSSDLEVVSAYARAHVEGLQGGASAPGVLATAKHWLGDGATRYGMDQGDVQMDFADLLKRFAPPYREAIDAEVAAVMVSFNSVNGEKCHGSKYLLTDVLKGEMGFSGIVISDWDGIDYLSSDYKEAIRRAVNAGLDVAMISQDWRRFILLLTELVQEGQVPLERIDDAVRRILLVKQRYGLFHKAKPSERPQAQKEILGCKAHRMLASEAVRKSLVLLKNTHSLLPLKPNARIVVAGKSANDTGHLCGGFTLAWQGMSMSAAGTANGPQSTYGSDASQRRSGQVPGATSIWDGIRTQCSGAVLDSAALSVDAGAYDVAVVVVGELPYAEGLGDIREDDRRISEVSSGIKGSFKVLPPYGRSCDHSSLHPEDIEVLARIAAAGIPAVAIFVAGRPLMADTALEHSAAFIMAHLPGSEGAAVADVLFGRADFSGKLAFDWPSAQLPGSRNHIKFERGFGLTYHSENDPQRHRTQEL